MAGETFLALELISEETLRNVIDVLVRLIEAAGALIIFVGAVIAFVRLLLLAARRQGAEQFVPVRLGLGRFLALGLEFQLAGDIMRTAIAPSFREIGQLAAIAAIRTALNYFLSKEIEAERRQVEEEQQRPGASRA